MFLLSFCSPSKKFACSSAQLQTPPMLLHIHSRSHLMEYDCRCYCCLAQHQLKLLLSCRFVLLGLLFCQLFQYLRLHTQGKLDFVGDEGGIFLLDPVRNTHVTTQGGLEQAHLQHQVPLDAFHRQENQQQLNMPYSYPKPFPPNYSSPCVGGPSYSAPAGPSYPPPPPPSHVGYAPTVPSTTEYINMPSSSGAAPAARRGGVPAGFAIGAGAGALAAGAVMFGGDFMSAANNLPQGLGDPSLTIATDPLF